MRSLQKTQPAGSLFPHHQTKENSCVAFSNASNSIMRLLNSEKAVLFAVFFIAVLWINLRSDFPLNDDWSYALNVKNWLETGFLKFDDWAAMTQLTHIASGALVSYVFGFSHITLHLLALGVVFVWLLFRQHYQKPLVTALVLSNPVFLSLSFTFMTHVLFSVLFWLSFDLLVQRKTKAAATTVVPATLDRQPGAGLGFAWLAESVLRRIQLSKKTMPEFSKPLLTVRAGN
jgi:hypothetical protein